MIDDKPINPEPILTGAAALGGAVLLGGLSFNPICQQLGTEITPNCLTNPGEVINFVKSGPTITITCSSLTTRDNFYNTYMSIYNSLPGWTPTPPSPTNINYYKYSHNKHTNFSIEQITLTPEGSANAGFKSSTVLNFKIKRYGDFLSNIFLTFKIPDIYSNNELKFRWITNIGYNYIKEARIKIGNNIIESLYGEWLNIWDELTNKDGIKYNKLIGNIEELINPYNFVPKYTVINNRLYNITYPISTYSSTNNNPSIKGRKIQVPLNFWFTKNPSLALPLLKMQNIEILLEIETNPENTFYSEYY